MYQTMAYQTNDQTLTPHMILAGYSDLYQKIYQHAPEADYMGNSWYRVNGELVHRSVLLSEIDRLRDIREVTLQPLLRTEQPQQRETKRTAVHRLIAKLRGV